MTGLIILVRVMLGVLITEFLNLDIISMDWVIFACARMGDLLYYHYQRSCSFLDLFLEHSISTKAGLMPHVLLNAICRIM